MPNAGDVEMIKNNIKKKNYTSRIEIIHENFFKYLEKSKVTQKKYSVDNNVSVSTISKWKTNTSCMNEEHIVTAAKYFKISVNQLYYTEQELKELKVSEDVSYDPIIAQHHVKIKFFNDSFKKPFSTVLIQIIVSVILVLFIILTGILKCPESILLLFGVLIIGFLSFISTHRIETFNINYLDEIFYRIENTKNKNFVLELVLSIFQSILSLLIVVSLLFLKVKSEDNITMVMITFFLGLFALCLMIVGIFLNEKELGELYYDIITPSLQFSYINFHMGLVMSSACICLVPLDLQNNWYLLFSIIIPVLGYIKYHLTLKKYAEYKIVYYEHSTDSNRTLFGD